MRIERDYRSLPLWLARAYLVEIGGAAEEGGRVRSPGWSARLREGEWIAVGSLRVGTGLVEFAGEDSTVNEVIAAFERKALRAGG